MRLLRVHAVMVAAACKASAHLNFDVDSAGHDHIQTCQVG